MDAQFWTMQILNGVTLGSLLFLVASGFTLIFGLMRIANLTHGALYLLGGYLALAVVRAGGYWPLAGLVAAFSMAVLGVAIERIFLRRLRGQTLAEVLVTVGIGFIIADFCLMVWGGDPLTIPVPDVLRGSWSFFGIPYPRFRLFTHCDRFVFLGALLRKMTSRTGEGWEQMRRPALTIHHEPPQR